MEFLLLDAAGAEVFADLSLACLADSYHVALVYDVSSRDSFLECQRWLEVCLHTYQSKSCVFVDQAGWACPFCLMCAVLQ